MNDTAKYTLTDKDAEENGWHRLMLYLLALFLLGALTLSYFTSNRYLVSKFASEDPETRRWAVDQIIKKGASMGQDMVILMLDKDQDLEARRIAIFVVGEIKYSPGTKELLKIFEEGPLVLRSQAAYSLGRIGDQSVLTDLMEGFPRAHKGLKLKIISALGEIGNTGGLKVIAQAMESEDELIRQTAEQALKKIREKNKI